MYKVTGIDVKNNRYKVLDIASNIESICTREQLMQSKKLGFKVFGVLPDNQVVVWDTFYKLSMLSDGNRKRLGEILKGYNVIVVTDDGVFNKGVTGNCIAFNMSNRTDMADIFKDCKAESLDLSSFDTSKVEDMKSMFRRCKAKSLDLSNFDTSKVENMSYMFCVCQAKSLDLKNFNTSKVENMGHIFCGCSVKSLDLSNFDTSKVENMSHMFEDCQTESLDLSNFDTLKVTDMEYMFNGCQAESLDLRGFDTSKVKNMGNMFKNYEGKKIILSKNQIKLIEQVKKDGQGDKLCMK